MKIHSALRKTEKSYFKEGKSGTNNTSGQVLDEIEGEVELRQREVDIFRLDLYFILLNFSFFRG